MASIAEYHDYFLALFTLRAEHDDTESHNIIGPAEPAAPTTPTSFLARPSRQNTSTFLPEFARRDEM